MRKTKIKLLIVDDDTSLRTSLSELFSVIGYRVRSASDGVAALSEIRNEVPDAILSDLNMPGMSGFELLSIVRGSLPAIKLIAMSGAFSGYKIPSGVTADAFYEKGGNMHALLESIEALTRPAVYLPLRPSEQIAEVTG